VLIDALVKSFSSTSTVWSAGFHYCGHFPPLGNGVVCKTAITEMDQSAAREKGIVDAEDIEIVQDRVAHLQPTHYRPQTDAEKKLDRRVNRKLDLIVVTLLAVEFIVCA
jgi:hypothetical protein